MPLENSPKIAINQFKAHLDIPWKVFLGFPSGKVENAAFHAVSPVEIQA